MSDTTSASTGLLKGCGCLAVIVLLPVFIQLATGSWMGFLLLVVAPVLGIRALMQSKGGESAVSDFFNGMARTFGGPRMKVWLEFGGGTLPRERYDQLHPPLGTYMQMLDGEYNKRGATSRTIRKTFDRQKGFYSKDFIEWWGEHRGGHTPEFVQFVEAKMLEALKVEGEPPGGGATDAS